MPRLRHDAPHLTGVFRLHPLVDQRSRRREAHTCGQPVFQAGAPWGAARIIVIALPFVHAARVAKPEPNAQRMEAKLAVLSQLATGEPP